MERCIRKTKGGTRCALLQSGLADEWWPGAMLIWAFLDNCTTLGKDGKTAFERFGKKFEQLFLRAHLLPLGVAVRFEPTTQTTLSWGKKKMEVMVKRRLLLYWTDSQASSILTPQKTKSWKETDSAMQF